MQTKVSASKVINNCAIYQCLDPKYVRLSCNSSYRLELSDILFVKMMNWITEKGASPAAGRYEQQPCKQWSLAVLQLCIHSILCRETSDDCVVFGRPLLTVHRVIYGTVVLSVLSVCNVGVLWSNGWYGGGPRPRRHCVRWGPSTPPHGKGHSSPNFSAHVYCGQTVAYLNKLLSSCSHSDLLQSMAKAGANPAAEL